MKYLKALSDIIKTYKIFTFQVLFYEIIFLIFYNRKFNKFKYLNSNFLSDSIPVPFIFLYKIYNFVILKNLRQICDLGSGYGKVLYYFGKIKNIKIDGVELDTQIYNFSSILQSDLIKIYNEDILKFDLKKKSYDLFILNDPLRKYDDLLTLINKIKNNYENVNLILINIDLVKQEKVLKNLFVIDHFKASSNKNIFFCRLK